MHTPSTTAHRRQHVQANGLADGLLPLRGGQVAPDGSRSPRAQRAYRRPSDTRCRAVMAGAVAFGFGLFLWPLAWGCRETNAVWLGGWSIFLRVVRRDWVGFAYDSSADYSLYRQAISPIRRGKCLSTNKKDRPEAFLSDLVSSSGTFARIAKRALDHFSRKSQCAGFTNNPHHQATPNLIVFR